MQNGWEEIRNPCLLENNNRKISEIHTRFQHNVYYLEHLMQEFTHGGNPDEEMQASSDSEYVKSGSGNIRSGRIKKYMPESGPKAKQSYLMRCLLDSRITASNILECITKLYKRIAEIEA